MKRWKQNNREKYLTGIKKANARRKIRAQTLIAEIKAENVCKKCGESEDCCLHFHHRDPTTKKFSISSAPTLKVGIDTLKAEIDKCDILCANCHIKHHAGVV